jgi:hypothetical protein
MAHVPATAPGGSRSSVAATPAPRRDADTPAPIAAPTTRSAAAESHASPSSLRDAAGAPAPDSLSAASAVPRFERRSASTPEIPGVSGWVERVNQDPRPPAEVLADLREARAYFASVRERGEQTVSADGERTNRIINAILASENARNPGLNAVGCSHEDKMAGCLRAWSTLAVPAEGHIRFHLGMVADIHRVAVDAFRHRDGGFTLVAVDSLKQEITSSRLAALALKHPDVIKGVLVIPTPNQAHVEGCRIFAANTLNAMHDFEPYVQDLHRQVHERGRGRPAPRLAGPEWKSCGGNTHVLADATDAFGVLDGKFFKHMQVPKPKGEGARTLLDDAEERNPGLKTQALNKQEQTLRSRFESQNPEKRPEEFSRADRTASLDRKRLVLIDRAIAHYERLAAASA